MRRRTNGKARSTNHIDRGDGIRVGVADMATSTTGKPLLTSSLGSCVAICIQDDAGNGGLLHAMLPEAPANPESVAKYVDSGLQALAAAIRDQKPASPSLTAKIAGGSYMIDVSQSEPVNERNVRAAKRTIADLGIELSADDTGGESPRSVTFFPPSGTVEIRQGTETWYL